jgi:prepilin-type N-terminal cleavage/methylation domain-containing protein
MNRNRNKQGFTMIELMVVVVIVGILAAIAIPLYGKYIKNARMTEAEGRIGEIVTACKAYAQENDADDNGIGEWPPAAGGGLVDLTPTDHFTYALGGATGSDSDAALTVTATGMGKMAGSSIVFTLPSSGATGSITTKVLP